MGLHTLTGMCDVVDMSHANYHSYSNKRIPIVQPLFRPSTVTLLLRPGLVTKVAINFYQKDFVAAFQTY